MAEAPVSLGQLFWTALTAPKRCDLPRLWTQTLSFLRRHSAGQSGGSSSSGGTDQEPPWANVLSHPLWDTMARESMFHQQFVLLKLYFYVPAWRRAVRAGLTPLQQDRMQALGAAWSCWSPIFDATGADGQQRYDKQAVDIRRGVLYHGILDFTVDMIVFLQMGISRKSNMRLYDAYMRDYWSKEPGLFDLIDHVPRNAMTD